MSAFQRKLLRTVIRSNNFQRLDAINGIEVNAARSVGYTKFRRGLIVSSSLTDVATVTRATASWGFDQAGVLSSFAAGQPVATTAGVAHYEARTNSLRNPTGIGAVAGSPGTLPTNWNALLLSGLSYAVGSPSVRNGVPGVPIRIFGNTSAPGNSILWFDAGAVISAVDGQTWAGSMFLALDAGTLNNVGGIGNRVELRDAGGGFLTSANYGAIVPTATPAPLSAPYTIADPATAYIRPGLSLYHSAAAAVDVTLWIGAPNLKLGADINDPPILQTTNVAATRNADVITEAVNIPVGQAFTVIWKGIAPLAAAGFNRLAVLADSVPTPTNALTLYFNPGVTAVFLGMLSAGVSTSNPNKGCTPGAPLGVALAVNGSQVTWSVNGSAVGTHTMTGGALSALLAVLGVGVDPFEGGRQINSTIRDLSIVMRAYSDAELQAASDVSLVWDEDFTTQTYRYVGDPYLSVTDLPRTTFTRATTKYAANSAGVLVPFASGAPAATDAGLSVEAAATNSVFPSVLSTLPGGANKWNANYNGANSAIVANDRIAPDGTLTAAKITTAGVSEGLYFRSTTLPAANADWTYGLWVYCLAPLTFSHQLNHSGGTAWTSNAQATQAVSAGVWTRLNLTRTAAASVTATSVTYAVTVPLSGTDFWVWGGQGEPGSVATSNITTTTAAATRNADALTSADTAISPTIVAEFNVPLTGVSYANVWQHDDGTDTNCATLYFNRLLGKLYLVVEVSGVNQVLLDLGAATAGSTYKVAARIATNDFAASKGGAACVTDVSGSLPAVTTFRRGRGVAAGAEWGAGIRRVRRYSTAKTNAELQVLATL